MVQGVHGVKTTQHALALDYVTLSGVMEKLQANIQEDHQLTCGFMYATWKRVRTYNHMLWHTVAFDLQASLPLAVCSCVACLCWDTARSLCCVKSNAGLQGGLASFANTVSF